VNLLIELIVRYGPIVGYLMVFGIIFAESGLLVGFFLPGDSLLFTLVTACFSQPVSWLHPPVLLC